MVALVGDAELDEGNIFEALLEGWKHDVRNLWWIDRLQPPEPRRASCSDRLFGRIDEMFELVGWRVVTLKYGKLLEAAFAAARRRARCGSGSTTAPTRSTRRWSSRAARPGASADARPRRSARHPRASSTQHDDDALHRLMTNLAGHDMEAVLEAFERRRATTSRPASSPTRSRASACPSPATRTTTPA